MCFMPVTDPKTVKNRVHLDLTSSAADRDQEIDRLLALGARRVDMGRPALSKARSRSNAVNRASSRLICPAASLAALARANGWPALAPPFAEPLISGQDAVLELAPVGPAEGVVPGSLTPIRMTAG
jgi:Glyoxalase-like domain